MDGKESTTITALIAGRPYPLKIKEGDEPIIRKIVKEVNDKVLLFQSTYPKKDKQDHFAMALLTYAVELHKALQEPDTTDFAQKLLHIDELLTRAVEKG